MTTFTKQLRQCLIISKSRLAEWVEHEKARADAVSVRENHQQEEVQKTVDNGIAELLALQLEGDLTLSNKENASKVGGMDEKQKKLDLEVASLSDAVDGLRLELCEKTHQTQGTDDGRKF